MYHFFYIYNYIKILNENICQIYKKKSILMNKIHYIKIKGVLNIINGQWNRFSVLYMLLWIISKILISSIQTAIPSKCLSTTYKELKECVDFYFIILPDPNIFIISNQSTITDLENYSIQKIRNLW